MANPTIKIKRSAVAGKIPTGDQLPLGEVALNTYDGRLFASKNVGIGTTVFAVNPWVTGVGTNTYNTYFTEGNVGIGLTTPTSKLSVDGDISASTVTSSSFVLTDGLISSVSSTTTTTSQTSIDTFSSSVYRTAKYNIQITRGSTYQSTEISIIHDGSDSYGTEYATLKTGATLATFSTDISGGNVRLLATPSSSSSTVFKIVRTLIEV